MWVWTVAISIYSLYFLGYFNLLFLFYFVKIKWSKKEKINNNPITNNKPMSENHAFLFKSINSSSIMSFSRGAGYRMGNIGILREYFLRFSTTSGYLCWSSRSNLRPKRMQCTNKMIHMIVPMSHRKTNRRVPSVLANLLAFHINFLW